VNPILYKERGMELKSAWERWDDATKESAIRFGDQYRDFLTENKTERRCVASAVAEAEASGYVSLEKKSSLVPGDKVYRINREKEVVLALIGKDSLTSGARIIVSHADSPRIDLKGNPLYEEEGIGLFKTSYYGGIKKYQWFTLPLALYGVIFLKDGSRVTLEIGDNPGDPVFVITDLLPHLDREQGKKSIEDGFPGETLNILAGSMPDSSVEKEKVKAHILSLLSEKYGIRNDDFFSAEIQAVPAGPARDLGFDRSLVLGYGQDDRACVFTSFRAMMDSEKNDNTCICLIVDQEEIGSRGSTSAQSFFFYYFLQELIEKSGLPSEEFRNFCEKSKALSADTSSALDPTFRDAHDPRNARRIGHGVGVERTTGGRGKVFSTEPSAEYLAYIRGIFDARNVVWQAGDLGKVDLGGGGTVATYIALFNIDTVDCGPGGFSVHAPFEVMSKADIYSAYLGYKAFYEAP